MQQPLNYLKIRKIIYNSNLNETIICELNVKLYT